LIPAESGVPAAARSRRRNLLPLVGLVVVLLVAAALRLSGLAWDEGAHLHPDERFLTMVETGLQLPSSLAEYFDTARSPLNPHNSGYTFFVYGTFPIFLVRLAAGWIGQLGYDEVHLVGRAASSLFDLLSLVLLYALGARLYSRKVGLLAAFLGAFTVLLIQHAHFFVVDPFANTFIVAGLYLAVRAQDEGGLPDYLLFGACVGAAAASKISALPLAAVLLLVVAARISQADRSRREEAALAALWGVLLAGVAAFLTFRVLQPYAFEGPAIWNILPNREWLADLAEVRVQSSGLADLPFALQWAARPPVLFALENMLYWGMGLPLGIAAWASWGGALVQALRGRWQRHLIPVAWTGAYFLWQSTAFTPAMRYLLPVYPTLILLSAWGAVSAWGWVRDLPRPARGWATLGYALVGGLLLAAHIAYGIGFSRIYTRDVTRVAATRWIYRHFPSAVNLRLEQDGAASLFPLATTQDFIIGRGAGYEASFRPQVEGRLASVSIPRVTRLSPAEAPAAIHLEILDAAGSPLTAATLVIPGDYAETTRVAFDPPFESAPGGTYSVRLSIEGTSALSLDGNLELHYASGSAEVSQTLSLEQEDLPLAPGRPHLVTIEGAQGTLQGVTLGAARWLDPAAGATRLTASLLDDPMADVPLAVATGLWDSSAVEAPSVELTFDRTLELAPGRTYWLRTEAGGSPLAVRGTRVISESSWDDGLPLRIDGRDGYGGLYIGLTQELYWPDDEDADADGRSDKLERIVDTLSDGDYLVITSNRQYGSIARVPVRYPLTTAYYRLLFECAAPTPVHVCAARAEPSDKVNALGYRLIETFQSNPALGPFEVNDQTAEEAFTVYDHPKVLVFARTPEFSRANVEALLGAVDLSRIQPLIPAEVGRPDLMLPAERLAEQQAGGTWSKLFPRDGLINRSQLLATVGWWLLIAVLGWISLPLARRVLPGFDVGAYALSRALGMLVLAWGTWFLASYRVPFQTTTILAVLLLMLVVGAVLAYRDRDGLLRFVRQRRREIVWIEGLALGLFLFDLAIRLGNPDLWHPYKGGEKPMDFSYFNAVLRSTSFPPYDPWFAGGYINYYYFGFVLVGVPVRLLGLNPAVAYNLILPTMFALLAVNGYAVAYELARRATGFVRSLSPRLAGAAAAAFLVLLGNLGTVVMAYHGLKHIGAEGQPTAELLAGIPQAARGALKFVSLRSPLPYRMDEWYWNPSRAIPSAPGDVDPITEFPFFTFLYADPHAHLFALPLTVLGLGWAVSWMLAADERKRLGPAAKAAGVIAAGLILGSLRPTNTWDYPVYLAIGVLATLAAPFLRERRWTWAAAIEAALTSGGLVLAFAALYAPYTQWNIQAYTDVDLWDGSRTSLRAYLTVHGVFLFFTAAWMAWETIAWMASTPISALARLRPYRGAIAAAAIVFAAAVLFAAAEGVRAVLMALPLMAWAAVLFFRPNWPLAKRLVLAMVMLGLALTLVVEVVVLRGDIGRMNTVFKFYLQVWTLLALAAAAGWFWSLAETPAWQPMARTMWTILGTALVAGALLFPLTATPAKIRDRMSSAAPHTLDGLAFMPFSTYADMGRDLHLETDARMIEWLQDNVEGSPVIVEAHTEQYRWGARTAIYTGLPAVLGWSWHQQQQRAIDSTPVLDRAAEVADFYTRYTVDEARSFLDKYGVRYIVVGEMERAYYEGMQPCWPAPDSFGVSCDMAGRPLVTKPPLVGAEECILLDPQIPDGALRCPTHGLEKFQTMVADGSLRVAYLDGDTVVYEVLR